MAAGPLFLLHDLTGPTAPIKRQIIEWEISMMLEGVSSLPGERLEV